MNRLVLGVMVVALLVPLSWAAEKPSIESSEIRKLEATLIEDIKSKGSEGRFVIPEIQPVKKEDEKGTPSGTATIERKGHNIVIIGAYYKGDEPWSLPYKGGGHGKISGFPMEASEAIPMGGQRIFAVREDGALIADSEEGRMIYEGTGRIIEKHEKIDDLLPMVDGSIHRFIGKHVFRGIEFCGEKDNPLTFALIYGVGYVYLHGKGTVTLSSKQPMKLGYSKKQEQASVAPMQEVALYVSIKEAVNIPSVEDQINREK